MLYVLVNGEKIPAELARISVDEAGFLHGESVYMETRFLNGSIFQFRQHLLNLAAAISSPELRIPITIDEERLKRQILSLIADNKIEDGILRIQVTRGELGWPVQAETKGTVYITTRLFKHPHPNGIRLIYANEHRDIMASWAWHRHVCVPAFTLARHEARVVGADDAVIVDNDLNALETTRYTFFVVSDGRVYVPSMTLPIRSSASRNVALHFAARSGIIVHEEPLTQELVDRADEFFVSSSLFGIAPVVWMNGRTLCEGRITKIIKNLFDKSWDKNVLP